MHWPEHSALFYALAALAVLLSGISKGGFGAAAGGGLAVPILSVVMAPPEAAAIMLPLLCAMDIFGVHAYRRHVSWPHLKVLLPGAMAGIAVGGLAFGWLSVDATRLLVGCIAVLFAIYKWCDLAGLITRWWAQSRQALGPKAGWMLGALSGLTSTLAHAGGPPFAIYVFSQNLDKTRIVGTAAAFFLVVNYTKLVPYYFLDQLNLNNLSTSLILSPLAPLGIWLGVWLHHRLSDTWFQHLSYALMLITGLKLIADAMLR